MEEVVATSGEMKQVEKMKYMGKLSKMWDVDAEVAE